MIGDQQNKEPLTISNDLLKRLHPFLLLVQRRRSLRGGLLGRLQLLRRLCLLLRQQRRCRILLRRRFQTGRLLFFLPPFLHVPLALDPFSLFLRSILSLSNLSRSARHPGGPARFLLSHSSRSASACRAVAAAGRASSSLSSSSRSIRSPPDPQNYQQPVKIFQSVENFFPAKIFTSIFDKYSPASRNANTRSVGMEAPVGAMSIY